MKTDIEREKISHQPVIYLPVLCYIVHGLPSPPIPDETTEFYIEELIQHASKLFTGNSRRSCEQRVCGEIKCTYLYFVQSVVFYVIDSLFLSTEFSTTDTTIG